MCQLSIFFIETKLTLSYTGGGGGGLDSTTFDFSFK